MGLFGDKDAIVGTALEVGGAFDQRINFAVGKALQTGRQHRYRKINRHKK